MCGREGCVRLVGRWRPGRVLLPHRVQPVLLVQELGDVLSRGSQHALVLQVLDASLGLLVEPVEERRKKKKKSEMMLKIKNNNNNKLKLQAAFAELNRHTLMTSDTCRRPLMPPDTCRPLRTPSEFCQPLPTPAITSRRPRTPLEACRPLVPPADPFPGCRCHRCPSMSYKTVPK